MDSTAMLIAMYLKGIRPDLIVFSDTGDEKKETYEFIKLFNRWLKSVGFPSITRTRYRIKKAGERKKLLAYYHPRRWKTLQLAALEAWLVAYQNVRQVVRYETLMEQCIVLGTLPSKAYGSGQCSSKWKIQPSQKLIANWAKTKNQHFVRVFIGINYKEQGRLLSSKGGLKPLEVRNFGVTFYHEYPLIEWRLTKDNERSLIASMGLPIPPKSSCKRCPNMTPAEVLALPEEDYQMGCFIEQNAEPFSGRIKGLGRGFSWRELKNLTPLEQLALSAQKESRQCSCID